MKAVGLVGLRRAPSWRWGEGIEGVPHHPKLHRPRRAQYGGRLEGHLGVQLNLMGRHVLSLSDEGCFFFFWEIVIFITKSLLWSWGAPVRWKKHSLHTRKTFSQVRVTSSGLGELPRLPPQSNRRSQTGPGEYVICRESHSWLEGMEFESCLFSGV